MIKVNLLTADRPRAKKKKKAVLSGAQQLTIVCSAILAGGIGLIAWRYLSIERESAELNRRIASAQREAAQLHSVVAQVQQFEQRKAQLQQRVSLIERLRSEQTGPVHMLDEISRALPPMLWLTDLAQSANPDEVAISGKCTSLTGLSDFVRNLEASGYFKRSVEIVKSESEARAASGGVLVTFTIRAIFQRPVEPSGPRDEPAPKSVSASGPAAPPRAALDAPAAPPSSTGTPSVVPHVTSGGSAVLPRAPADGLAAPQRTSSDAPAAGHTVSTAPPDALPSSIGEAADAHDASSETPASLRASTDAAQR
jgi:type IV pilus assembly protein PilN